jgi:hypothetical protein
MHPADRLEYQFHRPLELPEQLHRNRHPLDSLTGGRLVE